MKRLLEGKTAIITGSNRGIGRAILENFAENGASVFACARKKNPIFEKELENLSKIHKNEIIPIYFELGNESETKEAVKQIRSYKKEIDVLVNNAGILSKNEVFLMTSLDKLKEIFEVNFFAQMYFTQLIARSMQKRKKGSIIYVSSIAGIDGFFSGYDYASSKAALNLAVIQLSKELGQSDIRVNAVAPGMVNTDMFQNAENIDFLLDGINLGRFGKPEEIANAVMFLASDLSSYITGQIMRVDGGTTPPKTRW
ncbi:SDR family oxidoreductase [Clostridiales bacterium COT073_COT-073]|nr:SDR family oxidoreductase [Clostridiales bacterium COT073_COT-073]